MKLSPKQLAEAVAAARAIVDAHSTGFINYSSWVTDDQLGAAITQVLAAVKEDSPNDT